ncbi:MAG: DivIVA domain-containing protein [Nocardioides sp.]|nr:DivIVA domain-containing protein [Nocardioides sp.]
MGEVMPLTPEDVSNKRFTPVRLREGYDMGEVDQFLDEVEAELARLTRENDDLRSKLASAQSGGGPSFPMTPEPPAPIMEQPAPEPVSHQMPMMGPPSGMQPAQTGGIETIRVETVPEASNAAARLLELATRNHDALIDTAKNDADKIVGEARTKAERIETESKTKADRMESDARTRAQMLDSETAERRQQLFGELEREKDHLTTEVETLRNFEREYRSRLKSYFTQQLEALNNSSETQAPAMAAAGVSSVPDSGPAPKRLRSILGEDEG